MCGVASAQSAQTSIEATNAELAKAFNSKDAAKVASFYTEDAVVLPPNVSRQDGRQGVQNYWQAAIDVGASDLALKTLEVQENGDFAYEVGSFTLKALGEDKKPAEIVGKYVVVWKKGEDGVWRLHRDIWNGDPEEE
jgi:uncharacterized protein (TIGR02246 family)